MSIERLALVPAATLDKWREEAKAAGRDFYTLAAAWALNIDYSEVMPIERGLAKHALFFYAYKPSRHELHRFLALKPGDETTISVVGKKVQLGEIKR